MSNQKVCDLCGEIVTNKMCIVAITETEVPKANSKLVDFITLETAFNMLQKQQKKHIENTQYYEWCEGCKKVLNYLLIMRVDNLKQLKNEVNNIINLSYNKDKE